MRLTKESLMIPAGIKQSRKACLAALLFFSSHAASESRGSDDIEIETGMPESIAVPLSTGKESAESNEVVPLKPRIAPAINLKDPQVRPSVETPRTPSTAILPPEPDGSDTDPVPEVPEPAMPLPPPKPVAATPKEDLPSPTDAQPQPEDLLPSVEIEGEAEAVVEPVLVGPVRPKPGSSPTEDLERQIEAIRDLQPGLSTPKKKKKAARSLVLLGAEIAPGTASRLAWTPATNIQGLALPTPVLVINGRRDGPTLCLTAAIHGDELNGIEVVRRVMYAIEPEKLKGQIIGVPIVNLQGFQRGSRYLPDRRDLNRFFPGDRYGSLASRIAFSLFNDVLQVCDALVDIHTGSLRRNNLPQVRADMRNPGVAKFTEGFDDMAVVQSAGSFGMLRQAFVRRGVPAVTLEIGESMRIDEKQIEAGVHGINGVLDKEGMYSRSFIWGEPDPVYYDSYWVRAETGGILFSEIKLGDKVTEGEILGIVTDPITNDSAPIRSPYDGRVIGMAVDQVVMPGFAAYHIGTETTEETILQQLGTGRIAEESGEADPTPNPNETVE